MKENNKNINKINVQKGMIDSHFHLSHLKDTHFSNIDLLKLAIDRGLSAAIDIGLSAKDIIKRSETALAIPELFTAHGLYPSECLSPNMLSQLDFLKEHLVMDKKAIAVGEIGLDFFHDYGSEKKQKDLFINQISIANSLSLPVIIHSRNAETQTLELLKNQKVKEGGIIHCFSYSKKAAFKFIDMGFFISFAGNITYKKNYLLQEAAISVPLDKLFIETDAPYLSPELVRSKKNHPGFVGYTYDFIAELKKLNLDEVINKLRMNLESFIQMSNKKADIENSKPAL